MDVLWITGAVLIVCSIVLKLLMRHLLHSSYAVIDLSPMLFAAGCFLIIIYFGIICFRKIW